MFSHDNFAHGLSRAIDRAIAAWRPAYQGTDRDFATAMEKLDAALDNMSRGRCMSGSGNRLLRRNDRYAKNVQGGARPPARPQAILSSAFADAPGRFLACLPRRK